ncbi:MAG TPA: ATP-dependent metalloprotease, partial [Gammaproteobacteria bacterium]|nr:ATP-dependent metalloprotease [Gammaproteobacteria bacterium]
MGKNLLLWLIIAAVLLTVFNNFSGVSEPQEKSYSDFIEQVNRNEIREVEFDGQHEYITVLRKDSSRFKVILPAQDPKLLDDLLEHDVEIIGKEAETEGFWTQLLIASFPILIIIAVFMLFMRQMQGGVGGRGGPMAFGKSKARLLSEDQIKTTFADVAGVDEAKEDVQELVEFLMDPGKFQRLGGRIPRGTLMVGPPGTGKTLLAKAIAGEAKVPFFTISGSDFVEMFVGVGASRVRDMFEQAKKQAPCIIFIDEIDAVGRHRGAGLGGGHDEREQTLNQLLVEMDGFEPNNGVIVIAATNRPDVLDPALLRPGRFDRQVVVSLPDIRGREQILNVHMRKVPISDDVDPSILARGTPGFSGADLENIINEAALFAARGGKRLVEMEDFEKAKDKVMMGAERKSMVMSEKEKRNTAYHEAGHAIVGYSVPDHDQLYKITIVPRGRALGVTMFLPEEDRYSHSRRSVESQICSLFGGRIAEELISGPDGVTTGASNDIDRATQLARNMVTKWGLSERMGPLKYDDDEGEVFLGMSAGSQSKSISSQTAREIDEEIKKIIDGCYKRA